MFGCNDDVTNAGRLRERNDIVGAERCGIELRCKCFVIRNWNRGTVHDPLADAGDLLPIPSPGRNGVEPPMDEHAEPRLSPPAHTCISLGCRLSILNRGYRVVCAGIDMLALNLGARREGRCNKRERGKGDCKTMSSQESSSFSRRRSTSWVIALSVRRINFPAYSLKHLKSLRGDRSILIDLNIQEGNITASDRVFDLLDHDIG